MISHTAFLLLAAAAVEQIPLTAEESIFLHQLYLDFETAILKRLERRIHDRMDAEDQAQECMLRLARNIKTLMSLNHHQRARYITHTINSVISDYWVSQKSQEKHFPKCAESENISDDRREINPEMSMLMKDDVAAFAAAFEKLSEKEKALLEYRFMDGLSSEEIGRKLGIKPSAVRQAVLRAKQHVLEHMPQEDKNHG